MNSINVKTRDLNYLNDATIDTDSETRLDVIIKRMSGTADALEQLGLKILHIKNKMQPGPDVKDECAKAPTTIKGSLGEMDQIVDYQNNHISLINDTLDDLTRLL
jgi:hypothetical protein